MLYMPCCENYPGVDHRFRSACSIHLQSSVSEAASKHKEPHKSSCQDGTGGHRPAVAVMQVVILRQQLKQVCESKTVLTHLAGELQKAYDNGMKQFEAHLLGLANDAPAASFQEEGLTVEQMLGRCWPERLR